MKRAASVVSLLAVSLLLAGCDIPINLEKYLHWQDWFILKITASQIYDFSGWLIGLILGIVVLRTLASIPSDISSGKPIQYWNITWGLFVFVSLALLYILIPIANSITTRFIADPITIDSVLKNLHLELTINPKDLVTQAAAIRTSLDLPVLIKGILFYDVLLGLAILTLSAVSQSNRPAWFFISVWVGHLLFMTVFVATQEFLGKIWNVPNDGPIISAVFVTIIYSMGFVSYIIIPLLGMIISPEKVGPAAIPKNETDEVKSDKSRRPKTEGQPDIFVGTYKNGSNKNDQDKQPPKNLKLLAEGPNSDIVEGEFHEINEKKQLPPKGKSTNPEKPPNNDDKGPDSPSPQKPNKPDSPSPPNPDGLSRDQRKVPNSNTKRSSKPTVNQSPTANPIIYLNQDVINPESSEPKSKIVKARNKINQGAAIVGTVATLTGHPEVAATTEGVRIAGNTALNIAEKSPVFDRRKVPTKTQGES